MSGIAEVLLAQGFTVTGSDIHRSDTVMRLEKLGAQISIGHRAENLQDPTCVVVSSAIASSNPECVEARQRGIPVIPRAEMLAELMRLKLGVAVAGSHGKTTTTSMVGQVLRPLDPTVVVGGRLQHWNASTLVGRGSPFVIEADESDRSFLKFSPVYSIVTNVDREHLDTYKDLSDIEETFVDFLNRTAFFGMNWICGDCPSLRRIRDRIAKPTKTYGQSQDCDLRIMRVELLARSSAFDLSYHGELLGRFEIPVPGLHNVLNACGAIGVALSLGLSLSQIQEGLKDFVPADRRLQIHFENELMAVVEDYGHHPTEISATLSALRLMYPQREIWVLFQPHRYSRTQALFFDFAPSLEANADRVFLLPIYAAHEAPLAGVSVEALAKTFHKTPIETLSEVPKAQDVLDWLAKAEAKQRVVLVLGAGPLTQLANQLAREFENLNRSPMRFRSSSKFL